MKRYLVPFDGSDLSEAALRYAIELARRVPGQVDIVYVADERLLANPIFDFTVLALQAIGALGDFIQREKARLELEARLVGHGEELLEKVKAWPELAPEADPPVSYTTRIVVTNPPVYLSDPEEVYDIVFLGLWGENREQKGGMWGSTSEAVIRRGTSIVLLTSSHYRPVGSILVGFDNRPRSRQALAWSGVIGENMSIPVRIVTSGTDSEWREETIRAAREIAPSYHTDFAFDTSDKRPADLILSVAGEMPDPLICLGAFGDQPIREFFLGSVAEEILRRADAPVMLFK
jgi:nucleotide-binding universal stress UspA family protein